jgi:hypothetical protein
MPFTAAEQILASMKSYGRVAVKPQFHFPAIAKNVVQRRWCWHFIVKEFDR